MVGNHISAVNIRAVDVARNLKGPSGHRTESRPATHPTQGHCLSPEIPRAVARGDAVAIASHFDSAKLAFLPRLTKSQVSSEDLL
jgi:hypothetical protein